MAAKVLSDIEDLQWSALNEQVFEHAYKLIEEKYFSMEVTEDIKIALRTFFEYFRKVWVDSNESKWWEGSNPFAANNNQGIEVCLFIFY